MIDPFSSVGMIIWNDFNGRISVSVFTLVLHHKRSNSQLKKTTEMISFHSLPSQKTWVPLTFSLSKLTYLETGLMTSKQLKSGLDWIVWILQCMIVITKKFSRANNLDLVMRVTLCKAYVFRKTLKLAETLCLLANTHYMLQSMVLEVKRFASKSCATKAWTSVNDVNEWFDANQSCLEQLNRMRWSYCQNSSCRQAP